jgi:hypothetical protein
MEPQDDVSMTDAASIFGNLFTLGTEGVAGPNSINASTPMNPIESTSAIVVNSVGITEQLTAGVDGLTMNGSDESGSGGNKEENQEISDGEIVDYE